MECKSDVSTGWFVIGPAPPSADSRELSRVCTRPWAFGPFLWVDNALQQHLQVSAKPARTIHAYGLSVNSTTRQPRLARFADHSLSSGFHTIPFIHASRLKTARGSCQPRWNCCSLITGTVIERGNESRLNHVVVVKANRPMSRIHPGYLGPRELAPAFKTGTFTVPADERLPPASLRALTATAATSAQGNRVRPFPAPAAKTCDLVTAEHWR